MRRLWPPIVISWVHIYDISEVRVMHNIEEEIFSYMPKDLKIPDNVLEKAVLVHSF